MHREVGAYPSNDLGLHEVHGNVFEWCLDGFDGSYYGSSPAVEPVAPWEGAANCVLRGGSFHSTVATTRSADRRSGAPSSSGYYLGVRPARVISE